jgi:hypothetical protein
MTGHDWYNMDFAATKALIKPMAHQAKDQDDFRTRLKDAGYPYFASASISIAKSGPLRMEMIMVWHHSGRTIT